MSDAAPEKAASASAGVTSSIMPSPSLPSSSFGLAFGTFDRYLNTGTGTSSSITIDDLEEIIWKELVNKYLLHSKFINEIVMKPIQEHYKQRYNTNNRYHNHNHQAAKKKKKKKHHNITHIVCYGVGNFESRVNSIWQLAFILALRQRLEEMMIQEVEEEEEEVEEDVVEEDVVDDILDKDGEEDEDEKKKEEKDDDVGEEFNHYDHHKSKKQKVDHNKTTNNTKKMSRKGNTTTSITMEYYEPNMTTLERDFLVQKCHNVTIIKDEDNPHGKRKIPSNDGSNGTYLFFLPLAPFLYSNLIYENMDDTNTNDDNDSSSSSGASSSSLYDMILIGNDIGNMVKKSMSSEVEQRQRQRQLLPKSADLQLIELVYPYMKDTITPIDCSVLFKYDQELLHSCGYSYVDMTPPLTTYNNTTTTTTMTTTTTTTTTKPMGVGQNNSSDDDNGKYNTFLTLLLETIVQPFHGTSIMYFPIITKTHDMDENGNYCISTTTTTRILPFPLKKPPCYEVCGTNSHWYDITKPYDDKIRQQILSESVKIKFLDQVRFFKYFWVLLLLQNILRKKKSKILYCTVLYYSKLYMQLKCNAKMLRL